MVKPNHVVVDPVMNAPEAAEYIGVSRRTLGRLIAAGTAPKRVKLAARRFGFRVSACNAWLETNSEAEAA